MVQYIGILHVVWVKNIEDLKWRNTKKNQSMGQGTLLKLTNQDLLRGIYDNINILRKWNNIFILLSFNITFTAVSHLEDIKYITIFKYLKEIYMYCLICGSQITTLHVDGDFAPLEALIQEIPVGEEST